MFSQKTKKRQSHRISTKVLILNVPPMGDVHAKNQRPSSKNGLVRAGLRLKSVKNAVFRPFLTHHRLRWPRMMLKRPPFFGKFDSDRFPFFGHLSSSSGSRDTNPAPSYTNPNVTPMCDDWVGRGGRAAPSLRGQGSVSWLPDELERCSKRGKRSESNFPKNGGRFSIIRGHLRRW